MEHFDKSNCYIYKGRQRKIALTKMDIYLQEIAFFCPHSPTELSDDEVKDVFYTIPAYFNAQVGEEKHFLGTISKT